MTAYESYGRTLHDLRKELEVAEANIADLRAAIRSIDNILRRNHMATAVQTDMRVPKKSVAEIRPELTRRITQLEAVKIVLNEEGKPLRLVTIVERMLRGGFSYS